MKAKAIIPARLAWQPERVIAALERGFDAAAEAARVDFVATTNTWSTKPAFRVQKTGTLDREISTSSTIYGYVNDGTRPHLIRARRGMLRFRGGRYRAKTSPGVLGSSGGGSSGGAVFRPAVRHPGTDARNFDQAAKLKYDDLLTKIVQRAIDQEVG